jgi:hypothetical protein
MRDYVLLNHLVHIVTIRIWRVSLVFYCKNILKRIILNKFSSLVPVFYILLTYILTANAEVLAVIVYTSCMFRLIATIVISL